MFYDTDRARLEQRLRAKLPKDLAPKIVALVRPTVGFRPGAEASGLSKLGGRPDLPADTAWPIGTIVTVQGWLDRLMFWKPKPPALFERPHAFLGQIDLSALPAGHLDLALPGEGLLFLFHDCDQFWSNPAATAWRVMHAPTAGPQRAAPEGVIATFREVGLVAEAAWVGPPYDFVPAPESGLSREDVERYVEAMTEDDVDSERPPMRLGGWPDLVQGTDIQEEAQEAALAQGLPAPRASDWRLLVEVGSVAEAGMNWTDSGSLYFQTTADDVKARRWERIQCQMQCC